MEKMQLGIGLEGELFLLAVLLGCGLGLFYDIFRIFRTAIPHGKVLTFIEDVIFTFVYGFALFTFCTSLTGAVRAFVLAGMLAGSAAEHFTVGNALVFLFRGLFSALRKALSKTFSPMARFITKRADGLRDRFVKKCKNSFWRKKTLKST